MAKIVITTTSFGIYDEQPLHYLKEQGFEVVLNPYKRKLTNEEVVELCEDAVGIIAGTETIAGEVMQKLKKVKVISRCGAGLDNVDLKAAQKLGISVYSTPDAPTQAVAELTVGLIMALLRKISLMDRETRGGLWEKRMGSLLLGKHVGIIGFGRIGRKTAELLRAMGANVSYTDPVVKEKQTGSFKKVEFKELLKNSDIVSLHLSYSKENYKLIGKNEFFSMKQGAFLINCSRGGIVDEEALYFALKGGKLAGAALDVFEQEPYNGPLKELDNVILMPHIGSYAKEARIEMEKQAVRNLLEGLGVKL